jgi:hypothetical protein
MEHFLKDVCPFGEHLPSQELVWMHSVFLPQEYSSLAMLPTFVEHAIKKQHHLSHSFKDCYKEILI